MCLWGSANGQYLEVFYEHRDRPLVKSAGKLNPAAADIYIYTFIYIETGGAFTIL